MKIFHTLPPSKLNNTEHPYKLSASELRGGRAETVSSYPDMQVGDRFVLVRMFGGQHLDEYPIDVDKVMVSQNQIAIRFSDVLHWELYGNIVTSSYYLKRVHSGVYDSETSQPLCYTVSPEDNVSESNRQPSPLSKVIR